jgi:hypothetical protein
MKIIETANVVKNAIAQSIGAEYMDIDTTDLAALESFKIADVGTAVLESGSVEPFTKALITRMGKMVVDEKRYRGELPSLFYDNFEWGGFVERAYFSPQDILKDNMWELVNGRSYDDHVFYEPNVKAKIFEESKPIVCPISITEEQLKNAFSSWSEMNKFLGGIRTNVENTLELAMQAYAFMLIDCGIAVAHEATGNVYNLKSMAVADGIDGVTADSTPADLLNNEKFLVYALRKIASIRKYMGRYSTAFNNGAIPTFTTEDESHIALLTDFVNATKFNVRANTYNKDEIGIGAYDEISCWQAFRDTNDGTVTKFDFATNSSVEIAADATNKLGIGTDAVNLSNIIGVLYDHRAMGICPYRTKVTTNYTASADFWNEYHHVLTNYILDANYPIVVFTLN